MKCFEDKFLLSTKAKTLIESIYDLLANIPRHDFFLKDKINNLTFELFTTIHMANSSEKDLELLQSKIIVNISVLDFLLEILYKKKYISLKQLEKETHILTEINKMTKKWIENRINNNGK